MLDRSASTLVRSDLTDALGVNGAGPVHAVPIRRAGAGGRAASRPAPPYPDFPLFPHANGSWAKKIRGRLVFFGPWHDATAALEKYLSQRDALYAGRLPGNRGAARSGAAPVERLSVVRTADSGVTLKEIVNHFLTAKHRRLESGEMGLRSFSEYHGTCARLVKALSPQRAVWDLSPADFGVHRAGLARTRGPVALGNEIGRVRSVFKYALDAGLIDRPVRFGPEFVKPGKRAVRLARRARGPRMFEPAEIKALLSAAGVQMRAMILLGLNCGFGNTDIAGLTLTNVDMKRGIVEFPRPKTGIARRAVLWPETVAALTAVRKALASRPKGAPASNLVFTTKQGNPWVRVDRPGQRSQGKNQAVVKDSVGMEFGKVAVAAGLGRDGRGFYALRHTFRTVADEVGDRRAVDLVMGHEDGADIATVYVERISDARLARLAEHVRIWAGLDEACPRRRAKEIRADDASRSKQKALAGSRKAAS